jgi:hypothetical protein
VRADALLRRLALAVDLNRLEVEWPRREEDLPRPAGKRGHVGAEQAQEATRPGKEAALGDELLEGHQDLVVGLEREREGERESECVGRRRSSRRSATRRPAARYKAASGQAKDQTSSRANHRLLDSYLPPTS